MEGKQPKLTPEQREAIDTLSSTPQYQGESKIKIFMKIPAKDKAAYSRTHFLVPLLAAVIVIALGTSSSCASSARYRVPHCMRRR